MEEGPEDHDNPFIFKRSGRKSQVTLCRNSSELQPGVCGSSCQRGLPVSVARVSAAHGGPEGLGPRDPAPGLCSKLRAIGKGNNHTSMYFCVRWLSRSRNRLQCRRPGFEPRVRKMPWRRKIATHSSILAWEIPWTVEPGGLQSTGSQRVGHD